jgi:hypothetical protein
MAGRGPRSAIERAEIGNSRPTVVRACALLDRAAIGAHYAVAVDLSSLEYAHQP